MRQGDERNESGGKSESCEPPCFFPTVRKCLFFFFLIVFWMFVVIHETGVMLSVAVSACCKDSSQRMKVSINSETKVSVLFLT